MSSLESEGVRAKDQFPRVAGLSRSAARRCRVLTFRMRLAICAGMRSESVPRVLIRRRRREWMSQTDPIGNRASFAPAWSAGCGVNGSAEGDIVRSVESRCPRLARRLRVAGLARRGDGAADAEIDPAGYSVITRPGVFNPSLQSFRNFGMRSRESADTQA